MVEHERTGRRAFDDKNVGTGKTVTVTGATLAGAEPATTASPRRNDDHGRHHSHGPSMVSATGVNKVYDGTTVASVTLSDDR